MKHPRWKPFIAALLRGCLFFLLTVTAYSQRGDHSVALYGSLNEHAQIFSQPNSPDPLLRQRAVVLGSVFSAAADWRYRIYPSINLNLRGEFIAMETETADPIGTAITHGLRVYVLEGSALFSLPFTSKRFDMYVGGGLGLYSGERMYAVADVSAEHVSASPALGIQVVVGAEYLILVGLGVRFELLFRDPQMSVENRFPRSSVISHGVTYPLSTEPFRSNINLNGNVYSLGLFYTF
jgi:hypothetical protein